MGIEHFKQSTFEPLHEPRVEEEVEIPQEIIDFLITFIDGVNAERNAVTTVHVISQALTEPLVERPIEFEE
jgi:hypothetical protein